MVPPVAEVVAVVDDKWGDPPMPRDHQLLSPWTQQLLRIARSGKVGTKRKANTHKPDDENADETSKEAAKIAFDDRGYFAKKWKPVPEQQLAPEHKHFEFLAKRRKGLPTLGTELQGGPIATRKTKVQKVGTDGSTTVYDVLLPVGQTIEGEITDPELLADVVPVFAPAGTVIEGVGVANEAGIIVVEALNSAPRRNRPPLKKKGGPGRGKKRVTFTNPDGSTYTTIVPNATKIVPQPGQTVKHVAKGEEAGDDVSAEQAAALAAQGQPGGDDDGSGDDDGDDDGEEGEDGEEDDDGDDDREEGELSDAPAPSVKKAAPTTVENRDASQNHTKSSAEISTTLTSGGPTSAPSNSKNQEDTEMSEAPMEQVEDQETPNENADESMMDEDMYSPELLPEVPVDEPEPIDEPSDEPIDEQTHEPIDETIPDSTAEVPAEPTNEPAAGNSAESATTEASIAPTILDVPVLIAPPDVVAIEVTTEEPSVQPDEVAVDSQAQTSATVAENLTADEALPEQATTAPVDDSNVASEESGPAPVLSDETPIQHIGEAEESSKQDLQLPELAVEPLVESPADPITTPMADFSVKSSAETPAELEVEPTVESPAETTEKRISPEFFPEETLPKQTSAEPLPVDVPPRTTASTVEAAAEAINVPVIATESTEEAKNLTTADVAQSATDPYPPPAASQDVNAEAEEDLLGDLEKHLEA
jgi:hypothetical protein